MKFKSKYKSCLWSRKDIWGNLKTKKHTFLKVKWDKMIGILVSQSRKKVKKLCTDYHFVKPSLRANQVFKYTRWGFRNSLANRLCARRFFGDLNHKAFRKLCKVKTSDKLAKVLESRLDINLYRLGFFSSIYFSRQAILHGKLLVNGEKVTFSHFSIKSGDIVEFCPSFRPYIRKRLLSQRSYRIRYANRYKQKPIPWILTEYSSLNFMFISDIKPFLFYPYRFDLDELVSFANFGY